MTFWLAMIAWLILIEAGLWLRRRLKSETPPEKRKISDRRLKRLWVLDPALQDKVTVVPRRKRNCVTMYDEGRDDE